MALRNHPLTASKACGFVDQVGLPGDLWQGDRASLIREGNRNSFEHSFWANDAGGGPVDDRNVALSHSDRSWHARSRKVYTHVVPWTPPKLFAENLGGGGVHVEVSTRTPENHSTTNQENHAPIQQNEIPAIFLRLKRLKIRQNSAMFINSAKLGLHVCDL